MKTRRRARRPAPEGESTLEQEALHVRGGTPSRCPFCHDGIALQREAWAVCKGCLARHHIGCWREGGQACSACGQSEAFYETQRTASGQIRALPRRKRRVRLWFLLLLSPLILLTAFLLVQRIVLEEPDWGPPPSLAPAGPSLDPDR